MRKPVVLVTGAGGEIGHGLLTGLAGSGRPIVTLDVAPLDKALAPLVAREFVGSVTDPAILSRVLAEFEVDWCSTWPRCSPPAPSSFRPPPTTSTSRARSTCWSSRSRKGSRTDARWCSSIPHRSRPTACLTPIPRRSAGRVREDDYLHPTTMYGCNKLYCEQLGRYYALHYKQLAANTAARRVDFRSVRFPGLISATTMPAGGTSDYASEMIHAAARGEHYACFVRPDTRIPFMAMPDAVDALLALAHAPRERLTRTAYNLAAFSPSAAEIRDDRAEGVSGGRHRLPRGREAPGHRGFVADRRRRFGGAGRLAVSSVVRSSPAHSATISFRRSGGVTRSMCSARVTARGGPERAGHQVQYVS